jgi:hypothetical protein
LPQAAGNAVISCIHAAHTKYESNLLDWQQVVEIGWRLLTRQDIVRFQEMCKDELLGPGDYGIFEDKLAIDRSRDGYICIRDGLVLEGEVQEMGNKEIFYNEELYKARVCAFFLAYHQVLAYRWSLVPSDKFGALLQVQGEFGAGNVYCSFVDILCSNGKKFSFGTHIMQA